MGNKADLRRRWLGGAFLAVALGMLVAGQTVLRDAFSALGFLVFWFLCFVFTMAAVAVAFWDLAAVRRRTRDEQRELVESTLKEFAHRKNQNSKERSSGRESAP